jgi:cytochrome c peroxidase
MLRWWRLVAAGSLVVGAAASAWGQEADPAEVTIGERLFLETRFAEFFARNATDVNAPLAAGDPVVEESETTGAPLPGPFAGMSMNCRACHLVDEQLVSSGGGMRTYTDFARRSPIPDRGDGKRTAPRNSPPLVNASLPRPGGILLHFDGEFPSLTALVRGTLTGRNYGWLPGEAAAAVAHIARVVREDDGSGALAQDFGGDYRTVLAGTDPSLPPELVLPPEFRIDVDQASDDEIVDSVARLIAAYTEQLVFAQDENGSFVGSPFDAFLAANGLPAAPDPGESDAAYTRRLRSALEALKEPVFVNDGPFLFHPADRVFGAEELHGLRIFLRAAPSRKLKASELAEGGLGNCATCHAAPAFTDFSFHNTGIAQLEFDGLHGAGAFRRLYVPGVAERNADPNRWLPATEQHPHAAEPFRRVPSAGDAQHTDLGVWNVAANPDFPGATQDRLYQILCDRALAGVSRAANPAKRAKLIRQRCTAEKLVPTAIAIFKTPGLRDLSHSAPYLHNGSADTLEAVIESYRTAADAARQGTLRNPAAELRGIALLPEDVAPLAAFLRALNEDYE